jgi:hypothetical protein
MGRTNLLLVRLTLAVALLIAMPGCKSSQKELLVEKPVAGSTPTPAAAATPFPKLPPPTTAEVEAAFHRVFGSALIANISDPQSYIVGDFNGDDSEDIAIIARPASGKLDEINSEFANWIIQDADKAFIPPPTKRVAVPPVQQRPQIQAGEEVLALIHGYGAKGWRDPDARQAYLVKHATGLLEGTEPSISEKAIRAMHLPVETDLIKTTRKNKRGFIFWTGGVYAWHPREG